MRMLCILSLLLLEAPDDKEVVAAVQKTFDAMAAHDAVGLRASMLPDAHLYAVRDQVAPTGSSIDDFTTRIVASKEALKERFTGTPQVSIRGRMAQVWGEYEFLRDGKFSHCGVDSVSLLKTADGWKVATIVYTVETTGCAGR